MIWNYIRDFIVQYFTGGSTSTGQSFAPFWGDTLVIYSEEEQEFVNLGNFAGFKLGNDGFGDFYITPCDWLATTITAVIMVLMVVLACLLVRWVFKLVVNGFLARR